MPSRHGFVKAIAPVLRHHCDVKAGASIMVAVSGGADSVALLRTLAAIAPRRRWQLQLTIAHVQLHLLTNSHATRSALTSDERAGTSWLHHAPSARMRTESTHHWLGTSIHDLYVAHGGGFRYICRP